MKIQNTVRMLVIVGSQSERLHGQNSDIKPIKTILLLRNNYVNCDF